MTLNLRSVVVEADRSITRSRLKSRHVEFMAIGGAIGAGLFLGSGVGIKLAGPSLLLGYALCGMVVFFIGRAVGELAISRPEARSLGALASEQLSPLVGHLTDWTYWLNWTLVGVAEITAIGMLMRFWFPDLPQWVPALGATLLIAALNLVPVRAFGECEFWLSFVKVCAILFLIVTGSVVLFLHVGPAAPGASLSNLWADGGFFPRGLSGFAAALPITLFAFGGTEIIGMTAADTERPERTLPRAINGVILRILLFYIGSLAIIMSITPWIRFDGHASPYVQTFAAIGIPGATGLVNFIVVTAALSSCNTGLYAASRSLSALATTGHAPRLLGDVNRHGVPVPAVIVSVFLMLIGVGLNYLVPSSLFGYLMGSVAVFLLLIWAVIMLASWSFQLKGRHSAPRVAFRLPGAPVTNFVTLIVLASALVSMAASSEQRASITVAVGWFALMTLGFLLFQRTPKNES